MRNRGKSKSSSSFNSRIGDKHSSPENCKNSFDNIKSRLGDRGESRRYRSKERESSYDSRRSNSRMGGKRSSVEHSETVNPKRHKSDYEKLEDSLASGKLASKVQL